MSEIVSLDAVRQVLKDRFATDVEAEFSKEPEFQTLTWVRLLEVACEQNIQVRDIHPVLCDIARKIMTLRLALLVSCKGNDARVKKLLEVSRITIEEKDSP